MGEDVNAQVLDSNNPRTSSRSWLSRFDGAEQTGIARVAQNADGQGSNDVEANKTIEDQAGDTRNRSARVLDLASSKRDHYNTSVKSDLNRKKVGPTIWTRYRKAA